MEQEQRKWTEAQIAQGYQEMAEINLACVAAFFPLGDEVAEKSETEK